MLNHDQTQNQLRSPQQKQVSTVTRLALLLFLSATAAVLFLANSRSLRARSSAAPGVSTLELAARTQVETSPNTGRFHAINKQLSWQPKETAVVICDMWDAHWCQGASSRVAEMAPRMNEVVKQLRAAGVLIIHAPSQCMQAYEEAPARRRALAAPVVETKQKIGSWRGLDTQREGKLPIDDSDGGCNCSPHCKQGQPWRRQIAAIEINDDDAIADDAQAYYLMRQRGIKNVAVMGVHTNMCILGRPFSIREMVTQGQNVVLVRDLTDTMYNAKMSPKVNHFSGTDLVVEHIERHWCPTVSSVDLLTAIAGIKESHASAATKPVSQTEFRFREDTRKTIAILMAEEEYKTEQTLTAFATERLRKNYRVQLIYGSEKTRNDLPGIAAARDADVLLVSVKRRQLPAEQLQIIRDHVASGRGLVGIRTASHAFSPVLGKAPASDGELWTEFDHDILGGNYQGHHNNTAADSPKTIVEIADGALEHPIFKQFKWPSVGGKPATFGSAGSLYKVSPLAATATPLLMGSVAGEKNEPVAWVNLPRVKPPRPPSTSPDDADPAPVAVRVFYTSLGHADDFKSTIFCDLLEGAIAWAAKQDAQ